MKKTTQMTAYKGAAALTYIEQQDERTKTFKSSTADVAVGLLKPFPKSIEDMEIYAVPYVNSRGENATYPAVLCKDSAGEEHVIALSAFKSQEGVRELNSANITARLNLCDVSASYAEIRQAIFTNSGKIYLRRITGKLLGRARAGVYEYFTIEG